MSIRDHGRPNWNTSSFGGAADTTPAELSALRSHMDCCRQSRGRMFTLHLMAEWLDGLVVRFLITIVVLVFLAMLAMVLVTSLMH